MFCAGRTEVLPEQLQYALGLLVGLGQHSLGRLLQDDVLGELHHFLSHVNIADTAFGRGQVLTGCTQVVDGVLKAVLPCAEL